MFQALKRLFKRTPMLPTRKDLEAEIAKFAKVEAVQDGEDLGLTNFVLPLSTVSETGKTNLSFYSCHKGGTHYWKCTLFHGWGDVMVEYADRKKLEALAQTPVITQFAGPAVSKVRSQYGGDPVGFQIDFHPRDVDYSWTFELEPYSWPDQIRSMFNAWDRKIPLLDSEIQRIWRRYA